MTPLLGFMPDSDATTPGVLLDCEQLIPSENGMSSAPSAIAPVGVGTLADACRGAAVVSDLNGVRRIFAGTTTKIYELASTTYVDQSRVGSYTLGIDSRWTFESFGNSVLAANEADAIQRSTGGVFSDIATAPKADIIFSISGFVMALNYNSGTATTDGWACCAYLDETNWAPSVATQATRGRLVSSEGKITAGKRLGNYAVAYKSKAIYLGQYVGAPVVWQWDQIIGGDAGCSGKEAIVDIGGAHVFVNDENFWVFDGTRPRPLGTGQVRQFWVDDSDPKYRFRTLAVHDKQGNRVWFYYCSRNSLGVRDSVLVYHLGTKQWGRANRSVEAVLQFVSPGLVINELDSLSSTIDGLPNIPFDSQYWFSGGRSVAVFDTAHQILQMNGIAENSSMFTGDFGDDDGISMLRKSRLRFARSPTTSTAIGFKSFVEGTPPTIGTTTTLTDGSYYMTQRGRWHRIKYNFTGEVQITGIALELVPNGKR